MPGNHNTGQYVLAEGSRGMEGTRWPVLHRDRAVRVEGKLYRGWDIWSLKVNAAYSDGWKRLGKGVPGRRNRMSKADRLECCLVC